MGKIYKTLIFDGEASLSVLETTDVVNTAIKYHKLTPVCAAALGRTLTATAFMSTGLKNEGDRLSVTIKGNGAGGTIITSCDSKLNVRGRIDNPFADAPLKQNGKLDVAAIVGNEGYMTVVKSMGLKEPYVGRCDLVSGEIAEDFAAYYAYSEQQPTAIALGVLIGKDGKCVGAGGVVIQPLPGCSETNISKIENEISRFANVSGLISEIGGKGICEKYFGEYSFEEYHTEYKCNCSKKYIDGVLLTLGKEELLDTIKSVGKVEVNCEFCDKKYEYAEEDVLKLFEL
ncbi:MAG: Hsp33 family molecular chaperone HslO [Clostridia bacterium]|nr:Hsp33 family molecular chaperone HslO [Clostridia bacterium]